ncbi:hypothetical protein [Mesomycoplasma ovipneumoniae]|uniref:Uncharacterized protein n=1 Tax=Mesomycoplasma ovipneumoniae TaxID=29562 RepID=A0AAP5Y1E6_9BACT|nr:hypothetical protein [Mesomycoplasma ovipneumoniae]MDW2852717.1 hypothetical protein [Mesomycoplasma ovipneumoniae]MDW2861603.1 hypothetical protein [Mesomycoplasma ovipneumoniae]WNM14100.1 hypothetical protein RNL96_03195 [Mesomycoplasma ovipneumoniae]
MKLKTKIKKLSIYSMLFASLSLSILTPTIVAIQKTNANAYVFAAFTGFELPVNKDENNVKQYAEKSNEKFYFGISLEGKQNLAYYGGLFYQDKISWDGIARAKFRRKNRYNDNPKKIQLAVTSWISGMGSPSFQVGAEVKYDGNFSASGKVNTNIAIDSNGYLVSEITNHNTKYAEIDYDFNGWKYKVTSFDQYATASAEYGHSKVLLTSNSTYNRVSKLSESLKEEE